MFKQMVTAGAVVGLLATGAYAQESATIVMRSGEKIKAEVLDHGAVGFTVRTDGVERQIPTDQVAVVDFAGTGDLSDADYGDLGIGHALLLRSGQRVTGMFYDIGGTRPLRITMKTPDGTRDFTSSEVGRIVLARPQGTGTTGTASTPSVPEGAGIAVVGNRQWTPTGLTVRQGEVIMFETTGQVQLSTDPKDVAGPAGALSQRKAAGSPLPQNFAGALIGRVGNGAPFPIGDQRQVTMPSNGQLFLGINDDVVDDNQGGFRVNLRRGQQRR
jgi:hypothetical protein